MTKEEKNKIIEEIFSRGVVDFVDPEGVFRKKLESNPEKIVIKLGADPTRPDIHLGHAVILRKLRQFQDLGCKVVFIVGDFTAQIGDPTGKSKVRPDLAYEEVRKNMQSYLDQIKLILRQEPEVFAWVNNMDWFISVTDLVFDEKKFVTIKDQKGNEVSVPSNTFVGKAAEYDILQRQKFFNKNISNITVRTLFSTLKSITHSRLIARDMFQKRIKDGEELYMHEMLYPVIQGIDSYILNNIFGSCDMEVGGTDQHFNMLMGRDVMKINKIEPQSVMTFELLEGLDGKEKMSKSLDNYIGISDEPSDMYGKVMSLPDFLIEKYFKLCTFSTIEEIEELVSGIQKGSVHPKDAKMQLARQIVEIYHGRAKAEKAEEDFVNVFQNKAIPEDLLEIQIKEKETLADALVSFKVLSSKAEWRRLVEEGAITNLTTGEKIVDPKISPNVGEKLKIGKRRFVKIV
ncbi:MAG: tyrosine--tRNA ligase [Candidatus Pacebacteria bacterium]|nr:tyrosine--tRNA ligase [Candidatus Paceibacterota bacterium]MCF7862412.1 tyrosine--tRNA ligase [Candidatus Paceibacterota bacterium]